MLLLTPGETLQIPFVYRSGYDYVDPEDNIRIFFKRGSIGVGSIITGPYVYDLSLALAASPKLKQTFGDSDYVERLSEGNYILSYKVPENLFEGNYSVEITTTLNGLANTKDHGVQVRTTAEMSDSDYSVFGKTVSVQSRSKYRQLDQFTTNNVLLIGHTDAIKRYELVKVSSMQDAVNVLRADVNSPLLRGVFDAYSCGARDIYIMAAAPMSEYVADVKDRNVKFLKDDVHQTYSFYESYYNSLAICYKHIEEYDFFDFIVPLEASMINTGTVNFARQLANLCQKIQEISGEVAIGVLGSRNQGVTSADVQELVSKNFQLENIINSDGTIDKDTGKYLILVYGEATFNHKQFQTSYASSLAASVAGLLSSTQVNFGISNQRVASAVSAYGAQLTTAQIKSLNNVGINCITKGTKSRRFSSPYDVYISGDYTMSVSENFKDSANVRLAAMIISEIQAISKNAIGKFAVSKVSSKVEALLSFLKSNNIIREFTLDVIADKQERGKLYFNITITSSRTLREISFSVASGRSV